MEILSNLEKGNFVIYENRNYHADSKVKRGKRIYVILHSYTHPYGTYLLAPITSSIGQIPNHTVKLNQADYPKYLDHDSYIDLSFITVADKKRFNPCKIKDSRGKRTIIEPELPKLSRDHLIQLDLKLILALEMGNTINSITDMMLDRKLKELYLDIKPEMDKLSIFIDDNSKISKEDTISAFNNIKMKLEKK